MNITNYNYSTHLSLIGKHCHWSLLFPDPVRKLSSVPTSPTLVLAYRRQHHWVILMLVLLLLAHFFFCITFASSDFTSLSLYNIIFYHRPWHLLIFISLSVGPCLFWASKSHPSSCASTISQNRSQGVKSSITGVCSHGNTFSLFKLYVLFLFIYDNLR